LTYIGPVDNAVLSDVVEVGGTPSILGYDVNVVAVLSLGATN
jgi:hypothetical protein